MTESLTLRHAIPALRLYCGPDSLDALAGELDRLGCARAVVFAGRTLARDADVMGAMRAALGARLAGLFDGVQAHSPVPAVEDGLRALREYRADAVVALGGGSAIVTARASTILLAEGRGVEDLCTTFPPGKPPHSPKLLKPKLPQFAVPSTPTTAFAKAGTAVVDPVRRRRLTMFDPKTRAPVVALHPDVLMSAPADLVRDAALNAFAMAVQGIEGRTRDPLADALLLHALRLIRDFLPGLRVRPDDLGAREQLMFAALLSGQGTDYAGRGLASVVGHAIGARFHLQNGAVNAILLPHTIRFNAPATATRARLIAETMGGAPASRDEATEAADAVAAFLAGLGLPRRLRDIGVTADALAAISEDAMTDWFLHQNPRKVAASDDILAVLRAAW
jgi:alcohol dehydrogenase class IV